ncbi:MAG: alpha/beta fold hydrolase [Candidatus Moraniibacteriota bacterium]|jgi:serine hydrolase
MNNQIRVKDYSGRNKKQVIVIHGGDAWDTHDEYIEYLKNYDFTQEKFDKVTSRRWKDSLQESLGDNFQVIKPGMPSSRNAKYNEWLIWFEKLLPYVVDGAILVGHSLGANFLAKYLAENMLDVDINQVHLVAGCYGAKGDFDLQESLKNVENQCDNIYIYHSLDDFVVSFDDGKKYQVALPNAVFVEFEDRNHFLQEEFPEIVENIKSSML